MLYCRQCLAPLATKCCTVIHVWPHWPKSAVLGPGALNLSLPHNVLARPSFGLADARLPGPTCISARPRRGTCRSTAEAPPPPHHTPAPRVGQSDWRTGVRQSDWRARGTKWRTRWLYCWLHRQVEGPQMGRRCIGRTMARVTPRYLLTDRRAARPAET